jgi:hypothetical protein
MVTDLTPIRLIVFLDIDGVLNSEQYIAEHTGGVGVEIVDGELDATAHVDPARVARLNRLVAVTGAEVVLSSSWRVLFGLEKTQSILAAKGFAYRLSDATPRLPGMPRHVEIANHVAWLGGQVAFVILDDAEEAGGVLVERLVHVDDGLEDHHVDRAIQILLAASDLVTSP